MGHENTNQSQLAVPRGRNASRTSLKECDFIPEFSLGSADDGEVEVRHHIPSPHFLIKGR